VDLGRYFGRADPLSSGRGRSVDRLEGTAGLSGAVDLAGTPEAAGDIESLRRAERLREVRVMVSPEGKESSLGRGRSPMELRRSLELFVLEDAALIVRE
jgi:hypothetical protein